jgi:iron complex outermembrane receptor protein
VAYGYAAQITGDLGDDVTFRSISAYRRTIHSTAGDSDATPYSALQTVLAQADIHQVSEEVQLFGKSFNRRLDWITGFYFFTEAGTDDTAYQALFPIFTQTTSENLGYAQNDSWAFYAQGVYSLTDRLRVTAGARYVNDTRALTINSKTISDFGGPTVCGIFTAVPPDCSYTPQQVHFNYVPFTLGLDYKIWDSVLIYGKYSRGFRSGGLNIRGTTAAAINAFAPEKMDTWEGGLKGDFLDRHLRINGDLYYQNYDNVQITYTTPIPPDPTPTSVITNSGDVRNWGVEAELTALIGNFTLSGNLGTQDAKYSRLENSAITGVKLGDPVPYSPKLTYLISGDYLYRTGFGSLNFHIDYSWRDKVYMTTHIDVPASAYLGPPPATPVPFATFVPAYGVVNAMLTADFEHSRVQTSLWVHNLADKKYYNYVGDYSFAAYGEPAPPRTFGFNVKYSF